MVNLVRRLSDAVAQVRDEQGYIVVRERVHRNTAESTNGRVKWWSLFQLIVVIGEGVFQVWWLKRFFEVSCCAMFIEGMAANRSTGYLGQARCLSLSLSSSSFLRMSSIRQKEYDMKYNAADGDYGFCVDVGTSCIFFWRQLLLIAIASYSPIYIMVSCNLFLII